MKVPARRSRVVRMSDRPADPQALADRLGCEIPDDLLRCALTHRSYAFENGGLPTNERLEFLGDSVVGFCITREIFARYPGLSEGELSRLRAATVSARALAGVARSIELGDYLYLGAGEGASGGRDKDSILADACEAVIGAVFLACGLERVAEVIDQLFAPLLDEGDSNRGGLDAKTSLQELAATLGVAQPEYRVQWEGPDQAPHFVAEVWFAGRCLGRGEGRTKKTAEQLAAREALQQVAPGVPPGPGVPPAPAG